MEECLITNKVCSNTNKKCKNCKLDKCEEVFNMIETEEQARDRWNRNLINLSLPEQCQNCSFLEIIDLNNHIVRCPYMIKDKCLIKNK